MAAVKVVEFALEPTMQQARVLYAKAFPKVACLQTSLDVIQVRCLKSVIVAGRAPASKKATEWFLKSWKDFSSHRGAKIVLVLASPRPLAIPDETACGWIFGSHEIGWSLFSNFDTSCYVTILCQNEGRQGSDMSKMLAEKLGGVLRLPNVQGVNRHVNEELPKTESTNKRDLKILAAAQKLEGFAESGKSSQTRFVDASRRSLPVKLGIPDPTRASLPVSIAEDGRVNRVCMLDALGYRDADANLSLLSTASQQSMLACTFPAAVVATMLNAAAEFL